MLKYTWLELLVERQNFPSKLEIFLHVCLQEWPLILWGCVLSIQLKIDTKKTQQWGQAHGGLENVSHLPIKIFLWIIHHLGLFICLQMFGEKQPGLITSCKLYPFYSWKVYIENKNIIFSFHPTGLPQGWETRKSLTSWIFKHTQKKAYRVGISAQPVSV